MTSLEARLTEATDPHCLDDRQLAEQLRGAPWRSVVALGDSIVAGTREAVDGYRDLGWVDRVVAALDRATPGGVVARNLARPDLVASRIRQEQLSEAADARAGLAIVSAGGNDLLRRSFDPAAVEAEIDRIVAGLREAGSDVLTIGLIDARGNPYMPSGLRQAVTERIHELSARTAAVASRHGAVHADLTGHPAGADPGIYATDALHLNARGHAVVATATVRRLGEHLARTHP